MPSDFMFKTVNNIHGAIKTLSGGRMGWTAGNMAVLELTTIGRKSGKPRTVELTTPWQDGETMAIIASRAGDESHPAWFLNLRDNPSVRVKTKDGEKAMTAHIASAEQRAELWPQVIATNPRYADYQSKTDREIPVVLLKPVD